MPPSRGRRCLPALALLLALAAAAAGARHGGASLRPALEALQRRQRSSTAAPLAHFRLPPGEYDFDPTQPYYEYYTADEPDIVPLELNDDDDRHYGKYVIEYLGGDQPPPDGYYAYRNKKNVMKHDSNKKTTSAFRERGRHENEKLQELFLNKLENDENEKQIRENKLESDEEYAKLLEELWDKYKGHHRHPDSPSDQVLRMYRNRSFPKRQLPGDYIPASEWGPIAFKKKRNIVLDTDSNYDIPNDFSVNYMNQNYPNIQLNDDTFEKNTQFPYWYYKNENPRSNIPGINLPLQERPDLGEEYAIAFRPLDSDKAEILDEDDKNYSYDILKQKRFPVTKRSYSYKTPKKVEHRRFTRGEKNIKLFQNKNAKFGGYGTDPKVLHDLSNIFGRIPEDFENIIHKPVKRSDHLDETPIQTKLPHITALGHNSTNHTITEEVTNEGPVTEKSSQSQFHHPNLSKTGSSIPDMNAPISLQKKSIKWSDYFGMDKKRKRSMGLRSPGSENNFYREYMKHFYNSFSPDLRERRNKRNYIIDSPIEGDFKMDRASAIQIEEKRPHDERDNIKFDNLDSQMKNLERVILDEALRYSSNDEMDTKEVQEMKDKMLTKLTAAYSLDKMRKALEDFKKSLKGQKPADDDESLDDMKKKRIAIKKELKPDDQTNNISEGPLSPVYDNSKMDVMVNSKQENIVDKGTSVPFSEGYMGGHVVHRYPRISFDTDSCPGLEFVVRRCNAVSALVGDDGQMFTPFCVAHQICYICGEEPGSGCDATYVADASAACWPKESCRRAALTALAALRQPSGVYAPYGNIEPPEACACLPARRR